jgi:cytochrome c556
MTRKWVVAVAAVAAVLVGLAVALNPSGAEGDKDISIKEIMTKAHKPGDSLLTNLRKELQEDEPDWAEVQKDSKELVQLGTTLGKATPPRGGKESWKNLTGKYLNTAKTLTATSLRKDKAKASKALKDLQSQCTTCHKAHKAG